jgi:CheY-like chemotaxis protein
MGADEKKRMLIVDDQPTVLESLKRILNFHGYEVDTAENGREALEIFEPEKFAVIFTDFEMPEMNGHELASIIKARHPRQPIIMVTAYADLVLDMQPLPQVDLVMGKPWSMGEIRNAISKVLLADKSL